MASIDNKEKVIEKLKKRLKFYILGYIMGLIGPAVTQIKYKDFIFFPVTLLAILSSIGIGTAAYYGYIKMPLFAGAFRLLKYVLPIMVVFGIAIFLEMHLLKKYGINLKPYIGF